MAVKVPPMLHKMSVAAQKAWYKKNKMEYPGAAGKEGKSAAQAKKDVGEINKKKAREAAIAAAAASKKNKELVSSSERVRKMASLARAFGGERPGGDLTTNRGIVQYVRGGGTLRAGRLGEAAKPDASMVMTDTLKRKMITDKDKKTLGKVADLMRSLRNKDKKNAFVRQKGLDAMKAGKVDPARGHSPTRFGREQLRKEEMDIEESVATAQKVMDRANVVAKTNPDPKKRFAASGLAQKAMLRTINPTGVNTGITRGGGNKTYRKITGKAPPYQLKPKTGVSEEIEMNEGKMKDIVTGREETARLAAQKEPPFTPDKKPVRRGRGGPMSQAKWLAKQAMMKVMKKEEIEPVVEQDDTIEKKEMAQTQLHFMKYAAEEILEFIAMGGEIEEWYQNKLSKVHSDMEGLHSYIEGEKRRVGMVEEVEQVDKVKAVKAYDKEGKLVGRYRSMDHAKQMKPGHTYKVEEEVESVDEAEMSWGMRTRQKLKSMNMKPSGQTKPVGPEDVKKIINVPPVKKMKEVKQVDEEHSHLATFVPKKGSEAKDHISIPVNAEDGKKSHEAKFSKIFGKSIANDYELHRVTEKKKMSEALDPVGKEDADIDNDGDTDKTDVYLHRKRKAIGAAIKKKVAEKMGKKQ